MNRQFYRFDTGPVETKMKIDLRVDSIKKDTEVKKFLGVARA